MKLKQILISLIALAFLGGYYYIAEVKKTPAADAIKDDSGILLPNLSGVQAVGMEIDSINGKILLKKTAGQWNMLIPMQVPADNSVCDASIAHLANEKYSRKLDNVNIADFGLVNPELRAVITGSDNKKYTVLLGSYSPTGESVYAGLPGDTTAAYTVQGALKTDFEKKAFEWRDRRLFNFRDFYPDKIEVNLKDKKYALERSGSDWKVLSGGAGKLRADKVNSLIDSFKNTIAISMIDPTAANLSKQGLAAPSESVVFYAGNKTEKAYFGNINAKNRTRYIRGTYHDDILEINDGLYSGFPSFDSLLEKRLSPFDPEKVIKVKMQYAGNELLALKKTQKNRETKWENKETKGFKEEDKKKVSPASIAYFMSALEYKEKTALKPGVNVETLYGIKAGQGIEVFGENDALILSIVIGKIDEAKKGYYIQFPSDRYIYTIDKMLIQGLNFPGLEVK
jgi:hypothetical protein